MPVSSSTEHWIKPDALTINLNHFGDPDYLQVSVLAGAVVMAFKQDVIGYNAAHNYRTWPLEAANTYLETSSAYNVYARLNRSEVNARALIVYDTILRDIEGREITYEKNEETGEVKEILGEPDINFYFIFLGQLSSSISEDGRSVLREWTSEYRSGSLETNEQQNDWMVILNKMFRPHYDDPLNPDILTWIEAKAHMGIAGGLTSFIDNGSLKLPSIYDGLPIDYQTLYWDETTNEDGSVTKVLKARGIGEGGEGDSTGGGLSAAEIKTLIESYGYLTESKLPIASNSVKGIASFNSEQFSVVNGVVSFIGSTNNTPDLSGYVTKAEFFPFQDEFGLFVSVVNQHTISIREIKTTYATQEWVREAISGLESGSGGGVADTIAWDKVYGKPSWLSDNGINYEDIIGTPDLTTYATKDYVNKAISNLGSSGGGSVADSIAWDKVFGKPGWLNDDVIHYSEIDGTPDLDGYALKTELPNLSEYVDIKSEQTITGKKNFTTGGLFVNGKQIKYNEDGYWMLEGDLLVTGGITSFASASGFTPSTVMDGVVVDGTTIIKQDGKLVVVGGGSSGGVADSVAWGNILGKPSWIGDTKPSYSYSEISGTPDLSKYLTSHQTIYDLTFQSGEFTADTFDPNGSPKIIKIPTTTAHISESSNGLYFTNERAVAALKDTLSYYVDLTNEQEIKGRKNFTGGLLVNGQELVYNKDGYWKMEGNLLVTGGITTYSTDGNESPFMVDAASIDLITSESTTQVYAARATKLIKDEVISVGIDASDALDKLATIKSELASITDTSLISVIRTALINIREKI